MLLVKIGAVLELAGEPKNPVFLENGSDDLQADR
jgi:hypothetical protein